MSRSRYSDASIIDRHFYGTVSLPNAKSMGLVEVDLLSDTKTFDYICTSEDRLDILAARFFGDDKYWWVIALVNNISYPFVSGGITAGKLLKIPLDVNAILEKILK